MKGKSDKKYTGLIAFFFLLIKVTGFTWSVAFVGALFFVITIISLKLIWRFLFPYNYPSLSSLFNWGFMVLVVFGSLGWAVYDAVQKHRQDEIKAPSLQPSEHSAHPSWDELSKTSLGGSELPSGFILDEPANEAVKNNKRIEPFILKEFLPYLKRFQREATVRNIALQNIDSISINFSFNLTDYNTLGQCLPDSLQIGISESYWVTASDPEKEELIFHELGHCLLGRLHEDGLMPTSGGGMIYKSIMNSAGNALMYRFCSEQEIDPQIVYGKDGEPGWYESRTHSPCYDPFRFHNGVAFDPESKNSFYARFHKVYMDELFRTDAPTFGH